MLQYLYLYICFHEYNHRICYWNYISMNSKTSISLKLYTGISLYSNSHMLDINLYSLELFVSIFRYLKL